MKDLFFKHAYQKTWRQTEMAKLCARPRKKAFWPSLILLVIAAGGAFAVYMDCMPTAVTDRVMVYSFLLSWLGLYLGSYHFYWNLRYFPQRMTEYHRLHYCPRLQHGDQGVNFRHLRVKRSPAQSGAGEKVAPTAGG